MVDDTNHAATTLTSADSTVLEAAIDGPATPGAVHGVAAIAHPHPQYGGDMHNNVVVALQHGLAAGGVVTVRFNFRGVGASGG
jgi:uncharacterized protein